MTPDDAAGSGFLSWDDLPPPPDPATIGVPAVGGGVGGGNGVSARRRPPTNVRPSGRDASRRVRARKVQRVVTRLDPWSMLRVSLAFALCLWMIIVVAGVLVWQVAVATGSIGKVEDFLAQLLAESSFTIDGLRVFEGAAVAGFALFVCGALFAVVTSVLYNLISSVFGGLRVTVIELETAQPASET